MELKPHMQVAFSAFDTFLELCAGFLMSRVHFELVNE